VSISNPMDSLREPRMFSIGAVTRMTGISEATLRVWERRYHFPHTERTPSGHRLYSQEDVQQVQWVKLRIDEGMRTGQAIRARQHTHRATAVTAALHDPLPAPAPSDPQLAAICSRLLDALKDYNSSQAAAILDDALARFAFENVVLDVVGSAMAIIGDLWCSGEVEVAMEHFATNFLRQQLLNWMRDSPAPFAVSPIVLACAPDELHEGSLLILGALLRRLNWPVVYLGQALPLKDLAALVARLDPALMVFVAMSETSALSLAEWPHWLAPRTEGQLPIIGYGGRPFTHNPDLADRVPGVFLGATLAEGSLRLHRVMLNLHALQP
jgi:DNA-binding transcriptional MerR regulator